jgi:hypothetical protein
MSRRSLLQLSTVFAAFSTALHAKGPEWQTGDVASMEVIRTPVGKKIIILLAEDEVPLR